MTPVDSDVAELRLIGEWLNARFPISQDSDGDRVLAAADEIGRLRSYDIERVISRYEMYKRCPYGPELSDLLDALRDLADPKVVVGS